MLNEADIVIKNGSVWRLSGDSLRAEALAIKDGRIIYVGDDEGVQAYIGSSTRVIDAGGRTVLPGLMDTHVHLVKLGFSLGFIDLRNVGSIDELKRLVRERVESMEPGRWVIGRSWDQERFVEKRYPNRHDLDEVAPDNPVILIRVCGHVAVVNTKALELAGIDEGTSDPPGGIIEREESGYPNGVLKESALGLVYDVIPPPSLEDTVEAARLAIDEAVRHGLTTVHLVSAIPDEVAALLTLKTLGDLKLRIRVYYSYRYIDSVVGLGIRRGFGDDMLKINGIKILVDGSFGGRTAALREPYSDEPGNSGKVVVPLEELKPLVMKAHTSGLQLAMHAIGDLAVEHILESVEEALNRYPHTDHRHRIEHASLMPPDLLSRMAKLGMLAAVQPRFIISDFWTVERVGPERARWTYNFRSMLEKGIVIGGGSDSPVDPIDPIFSIYSAVTRGCHDGIELCKYSEDEKLSLEEAVRLYTSYAAYLGFDEDVLGSLDEGKLADLIILSDDLDRVDESKIKDVSVLMTIVDGKVVYEASSNS
jgi:hypothetical protein